MFVPIQPLFRNRELDLPIEHDCRRSVGVKHVKAQNQHELTCSPLRSSGLSMKVGLRQNSGLTIFEKSCKVHGHGLTGSAGLLESQCRKGGADHILKTDREIFLQSNAIDKGGPLGVVSLILAPARANGLSATVADKIKTPEIVENRGAAATKDFNSLL